MSDGNLRDVFSGVESRQFAYIIPSDNFKLWDATAFYKTQEFLRVETLFPMLIILMYTVFCTGPSAAKSEGSMGTDEG